MRFNQMVTYGLSLPKTVYFNFRSLPFKNARKLPIFVSYKVKILEVHKGIIEFGEGVSVRPFMIRLGFNGTEEITPKKAKINLKEGKLIFRGGCSMGEGCVLGVSGGVLDMGDHFSANKNCFISCNKEIVFGRDVMIGWNAVFFDAQGHIVFHNGEEKPSFKPIRIGNHVWVCAEAHVMKGSEVADGSIVAYRSLVTGKFTEKNILLGGSPAKRLQDHIDWGNFSKERNEK